MGLYKKVLESANEAKTISSHITALGKFRAKTEDSVLLAKIDKAIGVLQKLHMQAKTGKSTPASLDKSTDISVMDLINYCQQAIASNKPEWQVIAERNGWAPKP